MPSTVFGGIRLQPHESTRLALGLLQHPPPCTQVLLALSQSAVSEAHQADDTAEGSKKPNALTVTAVTFEPQDGMVKARAPFDLLDQRLASIC